MSHKLTFPCTLDHMRDLGRVHLTAEAKGMRFYLGSFDSVPEAEKAGAAYWLDYGSLGISVCFYVVDRSGSHFISDGLDGFKNLFAAEIAAREAAKDMGFTTERVSESPVTVTGGVMDQGLPAKLTFDEWLADETAKANASEEGKAFIAAGFEFEHTGGGCTAWQKSFPDGRRIMITDSEGLGHRLGAADANNPDKPDYWMIGFYLNDDAFGAIMEAPTHGEAVAAALALLFRHHVRAHISNEHLKEIDRRNGSGGVYAMACATHDFCDANMLMLQAVEELFGVGSFVHSQSDADAWNAAWNKAKAFGFGGKSNG